VTVVPLPRERCGYRRRGRTRPITPPAHYGFEGSQARGNLTVSNSVVPRASRSPGGRDPAAPWKDTAPPKNVAPRKSKDRR
jgi:hypothetical protein